MSGLLQVERHPVYGLRRRRIEICEGADRMIAGVAAIGFDNSLRDEIINLIIVAQRLALKLSDGHVAPFKMQSW